MVELAAIFLAYILGSIPWGYIVGRLARGIDIRDVGDGNTGAANVFREVGPKAGVAVGLADMSKGMAAVLVAQQASAGLTPLVAGVAAVLGHAWPVFAQFRGGRGAATALGVLLSLMPQEVILLSAVAAVPGLLARSPTLALGLLFSPLPLLAWWLDRGGTLVAYSVALPMLVGAKHFLDQAQRRPRGDAQELPRP